MCSSQRSDGSVREAPSLYWENDTNVRAMMGNNGALYQLRRLADAWIDTTDNVGTIGMEGRETWESGRGVQGDPRPTQQPGLKYECCILSQTVSDEGGNNDGSNDGGTPMWREGGPDRAEQQRLGHFL